MLGLGPSKIQIVVVWMCPTYICFTICMWNTKITNTLEFLRWHYWWPCMDKDVRAFVAACQVCMSKRNLGPSLQDCSTPCALHHDPAHTWCLTLSLTAPLQGQNCHICHSGWLFLVLLFHTFASQGDGRLFFDRAAV